MTKSVRDGDQPLPVDGQRDVVPEVIRRLRGFAEVMGDTATANHVVADINARLALGIQRYGHPLQTHNGRNARQDAYEECLDCLNYVMQIQLEEPRQSQAFLWQSQLIGMALDMRKKLVVVEAAKA